MMLDCGIRAVAESVPVGWTVLTGTVVSVGIALVVTGEVVKFPTTGGDAEGISAEVSVGITVGIEVSLVVIAEV